jgi:phosphoesterase RecJ-like protein
MNMHGLIEVANKIRDLDNFIITSHIFPDGDSIGSCLGLNLALKALDKMSSILWPDNVPALYNYLPGFEVSINNSIKDVQNVIFLDCSNPKRVGDSALSLLASRSTTINIDHHQDNEFFGDLNYVEPQASSTSEILYELINLLNVEITREIADCLYAGIVMDSGSFMNSNTTSKTMKIASMLLDKGADVNKARIQLFESKPYQEILLLQKVLDNLELHLDGRVAVIKLPFADLKQIDALDINPEGIINYGRSIAGVEVAVLIRENSPGQCKLGFRSKNYVNVADLASKFGGGGHHKAAGAQQEGDPEHIKKSIIEMLEDVL